MSIFFDEGGAVTLPAGRIQIEGRYQNEGLTAFKIYDSTKKFLVTSVKYLNVDGLAQDATNFFDVQLKNGATVLANWSTETTVGEGTLTADTWVDMTLSAVDGELILDIGDELLLNLAEDGTTTLPAGRIQIEGHYL